MNRSGKISTFLLVILTVIFLCVALITSFLLKQETDRRIAVEKSLSEVTAAKEDLQRQYDDSKKQLFLLQEKVKQADLKIKSLISDLDLAKSQQELIVNENTSLKENLTKEQAEKEKLMAQAKQAEDALKTLREKLANLEKTTPAKTAEATAEKEEVPLGKIVVNPEEVPAIPSGQGSILTVNKQYQFVVTNLGQQDEVVPEQIIEVSRDNQVLGEMKIQRVQGNLSVADPIPPLKVEMLKEGDRVNVKQ